jgi:hypothetical protein
MGLIKRFTKEVGRSPNPGELTNLKKMAKDMESSEKVIPFPESRITDPFKPRPTEEVFNKLIDPKSNTGIKLGKIREGLRKKETEAEILKRLQKEKDDAVKRLRKKKEKDLGDKLKARNLYIVFRFVFQCP